MSDNSPIDFCVLIPCYNNYEGLVRSLKTIVYDSNRFVVVVVDDGSRDAVALEQLRQDVVTEMDIRVLTMEQNGGITKALNAGLKWILENLDTRFIARLDCGDLCDRQRFSRQFKLMNEDPSLVLTGTWCYFRESFSGRQYSYITPTHDEKIRLEMYTRNVFIHPTVMMRSDKVQIVGFYPDNFELAEDYALFWNLLKLGKAAVIGEFLVICEIRKGGLSFSNKSKQLAARWKVIKMLGSDPVLKLKGYSRLLGLFILPKEVILWLKHKKT
ncbi:MAG: glycosyltransferase [Chitinophagaceae bacterium]